MFRLAAEFNIPLHPLQRGIFLRDLYWILSMPRRGSSFLMCSDCESEH
jgi:hypothetical protein